MIKSKDTVSFTIKVFNTTSCVKTIFNYISKIANYLKRDRSRYF